MTKTSVKDKVAEVPVLEGWLTAEQAAAELEVSRQTAARLYQRRQFRTLHAVGDRPLYIVRIEEIKALHEAYERTNSWDESFAEVSALTPRKLGIDPKRLGIDPWTNGNKQGK